MNEELEFSLNHSLEIGEEIWIDGVAIGVVISCVEINEAFDIKMQFYAGFTLDDLIQIDEEDRERERPRHHPLTNIFK